MTIGERISTLRKENGISQGQLAQHLAVTRQAVSKWENDLTSPDTIRLIQLADLLNTEVEYLATGRKPVYQAPSIVVNLVKKPDPPAVKTVVKQVIKIKYRRFWIEYIFLSIFFLVIGILIGLLL